MSTQALLIVTAFVEVGAGIAQLGVPSLAAEILLGEGLANPQSVVVARVAGFAVISLGVACWSGRNGERRAQAGLVAAMLIYNLAVPVVLVHAWIGFALQGQAFWPACLLHTALAIWCIAGLWPITSSAK